mgnify:CR=1 FL=1
MNILKENQEEVYRLWYLFNMERGIATSLLVVSELISLGITAEKERNTI